MLCKTDILKDFVKFFFRNFLVDFAKSLRKNNYYCIYCLDMLKTFQRETKLFEYSRNMNREEMSIRKNNVTLQWLRCNVFFSIALLQWFCWNGFDVRCNGFRFSCLSMFANKVTIFLDNGFFQEISTRPSRNSKPMKMQH